MRLRIVGCLAAIASCGLAQALEAATVWDESVNGDLSNAGVAPTVLGALGLGSHVIIGETGTGQSGLDRDYFTFTVPVGSALTSFKLLPDSSFSGGAAFVAMQAGPQVTADPISGAGGPLMGYLHYNETHIGTDILAAFTLAGSLPSGAYSVWVQELGQVVPYGFELTVAPVPLPAAAMLLVSGLAGLGALRRRRAG